MYRTSYILANSLTILLAMPLFARGNDAVEQAVSSVVRVAHKTDGHSGVGVIISPEGHVLLNSVSHLDQKPLFVFLADGKMTEGTLLAWSEEWNMSIAKLTDSGPWPFANVFTSSESVEMDDLCFVCGYKLHEDGWAKHPVRCKTQVNKTASNVWFGTEPPQVGDEGAFVSFGPLFDSNGTVLGFASSMGGGQWAYLHVYQINVLRGVIASDDIRNLDQKRLRNPDIRDENLRPYEIKASTRIDPSEAKHAATNSTVRILPPNGGNGASGVIISANGFIVSCGHGYDTPGTEVVVQLPDGRNSAGKFVGVNPITDIALLKIKGDGPWPFVPLAESSWMNSDTPCWVIGYPSTRDVRSPLVRETRLTTSKRPEYHVLYSQREYKMYGGDSGGGLFDTQGRLLGIHQGKNSDGKTPGRHTRVETLRVQWDVLTKMDDDRHR